MKIEVYDENKKEEPILHIRLVKLAGESFIRLVAVDEEGDRIQTLLTINERGIKRIGLNNGFIAAYNLNTDDMNQLKVE